MRKYLLRSLVLIAVFSFSSCGFGFSEGQTSVVDSDVDVVKQEEVTVAGDDGNDKKNILLIAGEGGPSGSMFIKAAQTYKMENGGEIYEVFSGDQFNIAINDFVGKFGKIDHFVYFGHGNHVWLYVNQEPNVNGAVYANDTALNKSYVSSSIYELDPNIFDKWGWIKFNGCNVASGYPEVNSLAQSFANYFNVDVVAPRGPTEFSKSPDFVDPIENSNYLDPNFDGDVYMVSTYADKDFIVVKPQEVSQSGFIDVKIGQSYEVAVSKLMDRGLKLDFKDKKFMPYKNITYAEAREFCKVAVEDEPKCWLSGEKDDQWIRNLKALKILTDAYGVQLKYTNPWYNSYIWWAKNENLLTRDFTDRKWYTRGEMAELTWNFILAQE